MRLPKLLTALSFSAWLFAPPASAATSFATPPFFVEEGESVECTIVYLGRKELSVEPQVRKSGAVVQSSGQNLLSETQVATTSYLAPTSDTYWCQFLGRIKAKDVRASGQVRDGGGAVRLLVPAQ